MKRGQKRVSNFKEIDDDLPTYNFPDNKTLLYRKVSFSKPTLLDKIINKLTISEAANLGSCFEIFIFPFLEFFYFIQQPEKLSLHITFLMPTDLHIGKI